MERKILLKAIMIPLFIRLKELMYLLHNSLIAKPWIQLHQDIFRAFNSITKQV